MSFVIRSRKKQQQQSYVKLIDLCLTTATVSSIFLTPILLIFLFQMIIR